MAKTNRRWTSYQQEDEYDGRFVREQYNRSNRLRIRQTLRTIDYTNPDSVEDFYE